MMWEHYGQKRPDFAERPGPGQESVWDYPRPPKIEHDGRTVVVRHKQEILAATNSAVRVLETASPPTIYIPPADVKWKRLLSIPGTSHCEWKGSALYWTLKEGDQRIPVGWSYPEPTAAFTEICEFICFYPGRVICYIGEEQVRPQPGEFYGGWVTNEIVGPFKGEPGTTHW